MVFNENTSLIDELDGFATLMSGSPQGLFYKKKAKDAKQVKVSKLADVLTNEQIRHIKKHINPKQKECYKNATLVADYLGCQYVEGMIKCIMGIDHAFNKVGDKYIDVTAELVLKKNVEEIEYVSIGEYSAEQTMKICVETGYYGNIYNELYIKSLK